MNQLKRKGILLLLSSVMLVTSGIYLTYAWYTKVTSVSGMEFDAAQWEFTANYEVSDFVINVNSYSTSAPQKAAPGTAGEIPIQLGAEQSDTDVDYQIWIDKSTMSPEFQERIYFYYIDRGERKLFLSDTPIEGTIDARDSTEVTIYWEWLYEYEDLLELLEEYSDVDPIDGSDEVEFPIEETSEEFDEFDTDVGRNPALYEPYMSATLKIVGTQSSPAE